MDLKVEEKILLNKIVENIKWDENGKQPIKVKCSDNTTYEADHVIVTVSLGVLKSDYRTLFTPQLPISTQNAIEGLSMGTMNKILLEFEKPFWTRSEWSGMDHFQKIFTKYYDFINVGFGMLWTQEDLNQIKDTDKAWVKDIAGFWRVSYQPNLLFAFTFGETSRKIEKMDESEVLDGVMFLFDKFLSPRMNYTTPIKIATTKWTSNPHVRGSYSVRTLIADAFNTAPKFLAKPINDSLNVPRILFAGEASHNNFFGTAHGAIETGYREAERIISYYED
jgi:spermine oxidase